MPASIRAVGIAVATLTAGWITATSLYGVYTNHVPVPFFDEWEYVNAAAIWDGLFKQHNEHRIALPRLIFLADLYFANGSGLLSIAAAQIMQLAHVGALAGLAYFAAEKSMAWLFGAVVAAFLFSALQLDNLQVGFQVQFTAVYTLATLAFLCLAAIPAWTGVVLALVCASAAALCMANGLLAAALLVPMAVMLGRPLGHVIVLASIGAAIWGAYLSGYSPVVQHGSMTAALVNPGPTMQFWLELIGSAPGRVIAVITGSHHESAATLGLFGICAAVAWVWHNRSDFTRPNTVILAIIAFILGSTAMIALGRVLLGGDISSTTRYATPSLIFWASLLLCALLTRRAIATYTAAGAAIALAIVQPILIHRTEQDRANRVLAATAILSGAADLNAIQHVYPDPARVLAKSQFLREAHAALFEPQWAHWKNLPLTSVAVITRDGCAGSVDSITTIDASTRVSGWAWSFVIAATPHAIVFAAETGRIAGVGIVGAPRPDVPRNRSDVASSYSGWSGHVAGDAKEAIAYAILMNTNDKPIACRFGAFELPTPSAHTSAER